MVTIARCKEVVRESVGTQISQPDKRLQLRKFKYTQVK